MTNTEIETNMRMLHQEINNMATIFKDDTIFYKQLMDTAAMVREKLIKTNFENTNLYDSACSLLTEVCENPVTPRDHYIKQVVEELLCNMKTICNKEAISDVIGVCKKHNINVEAKQYSGQLVYYFLGIIL